MQANPMPDQTDLRTTSKLDMRPWQLVAITRPNRSQIPMAQLSFWM